MILSMFSVLIPARTWFAPSQPLNVSVRSNQPLTLVLTDFAGQTMEAQGSAQVAPDTQGDVRAMFPALAMPGTYLLYAVPADGVGSVSDFVGTPLVIEARQDRRRPPGSGPIVYKVTPLSYAVMHTDQGQVTLKFYYNDAPNTVASFIDLARGGYYDGLAFHRIVPGFVIQGGDPLGDGTGGPGYHIDAEFNDRPHHEGVLSMAREGDPNEAPGILPGPVAANSAGSQFFICLNYENTQQLDGRYTAFGEVTDGMDVVRRIAAVPLADERAGRPVKAPVIQSVEIKPVLPNENPYQPKPETPATTQSSPTTQP